MTAGSQIPRSAHTTRGWRIHDIAYDFHLEDVWDLPVRGGRDDFGRLVALFAAGDPSRMPSRTARALWTLRFKLGAVLGWDDDDTGLGGRVETLRERLPDDLRAAAEVAPGLANLPFTPLYALDDEWAGEIANRTVHAVMHLGWVPDGQGGYRGQMAVLVKPNGLLGNAYMMAIKPFRYRLVYPPMMRMIGREWTSATAATT